MSTPAWCNTPQLQFGWTKPWLVPLRGSEARRFKKRLWRHGYLSPNFTRAEAASKDGKPIPRRLRQPAQRQAFHMERVRHLCGDQSILVNSWYRSWNHNQAVGGASRSQHLNARACDVFDQTIFRIGEQRWNDACMRVFKRGGIGFAYGTRVRHVDSRRGPAHWFY